MEHDDYPVLELRYSGWAVKDHTLRASGIAQMLQAADAVLGGYRDAVSALMDAHAAMDAMRIRGGSCHIRLRLIGTRDALNTVLDEEARQSALHELADDVQHTLELVNARCMATGHPLPTDEETATYEESTVTVRFTPNSEPRQTTLNAYRASQRQDVVSAMGRMLGAGQEGIASASVSSHGVDAGAEGGAAVVTLPIARIDAFRDAQDQPKRIEALTEQRSLQIDTIQFSSDKWRFRDGDDKFYARIEDSGFLAKWNRGDVSFRKGDTLHVSMRIERTSVGGRIELGERVITQVRQPRHKPFQPSIEDLLA